uniref:uncharacterized protein LOC127072340 isoform X1 n=2 Tax=Vespula vulgaris TaxID=7454 RepID=UPI0021448151|nr:uncharacterized protein LOC127072340 isoform X1 [Vespula vulgaris]
MFITLLHVFSFFRKYAYDSYCTKKENNMNTSPAVVRDKIYDLIDPDTLLNYYEEKRIRFSPPASIQRYYAAVDILSSDKYEGQIRKIVDFGCANLNFLVHLKSIPDVDEVLCVDIDRTVLDINKGKARPLVCDFLHCRQKPFAIHVYEGSVTDHDTKLEKTDAVTCIELIEHLYPDALTDLPFNIFGYIKPRIVIITTPNVEFNVLFSYPGFRHLDHKFEWTREQFQDWGRNIVLRYPDYQVTFHGICDGPEGTEHLGACTQMAVFCLKSEKSGSELLGTDNLFKLVSSHSFPYRVDARSDEQKILDDVTYHVNQAMTFDNLKGELSLESLVTLLSKFKVTMASLRIILEEAGWPIVDHGEGPVTYIPEQSIIAEVDDGRLNERYEIGRYFEGYTEEPWQSDSWDEERSDSSDSTIDFSDTFLFDVEHESPDVNNLSDSINVHESSVDSIPNNSILQNDDAASSLEMKSCMLSDSDTTTNANTHNDDNTFIKPAEGLNETLDFYHSTSVLSSSISPQPLLIHLDQLNSSYCDDTVTDKNVSHSSLLNNTFHSLDTLRDESVNLEEATASYCMHFDTSLNGKVSSCTECTNYFQNEIDECNETSIAELEQVNAEEKKIYYEDHFVPEDCVAASSTNQPQYTSSPRSIAKANKETNCNRKSLRLENISNEDSDLTLQSEEIENVNNIQFETCLIKTVIGCKNYPNNFSPKSIKCSDRKPNSPESLETPPNSWSPEIIDSGYPNSASAPDMTPEYDLSSIAHDRIPDSESPSVAEAPQFENLEPVVIENGDLANNNRDNEGNNMMAVADNDIENLQPFINVLENDLENENDIYVVENGFPVWLLRILEMANPMDVDGHILRDPRELVPFDLIEGGAEYLGIDRDEGFDSNSSVEDSDQNNDEISSNFTDANNIDNNNEVIHDTDSEDGNNFEDIVSVHYSSNSNADSDEWVKRNT